MELPGETRGLLRPVPKWGASSIGSIAIGQEIAVTPIQLVSMVSTIANGGVYLPPHIVMETKPGQVDSTSSGLVATPFKANEELSSPLPEGAHRVITTLAAAQMRGMMEDVVLYGTGKPAQLNGYSAGGKTGTAQKIDPATHRYSKTMHVASFAGIAPVNSPVIAVAVVMDDPHGDYYGTTVSAPVFSEVAQQVLEYLGVPHDTEVHPARAGKPVVASKDVELDHEETGDETALAKALDELPADDPLRQAVDGSQTSGRAVADAVIGSSGAAKSSASGVGSAASNTGAMASAQEQAASGSPAATSVVTIKTEDASQQVRMPSLLGLPVRQVVEQVAQAGLTLHLEGRGLARSQEPAAGSVVAPGSKVTVHCSR
uniref:Peptidoglycan glycosyltransferase n=1 Tax=mine drainage metagenome TaxID=410659 RepID=E6QKP1_9ZZZZ